MPLLQLCAAAYTVSRIEGPSRPDCQPGLALDPVPKNRTSHRHPHTPQVVIVIKATPIPKSKSSHTKERQIIPS